MSDRPPSLDLARNPAARRKLARKLLRWFHQHARDLPWRRTDDLYRIWISEIMLQQTQVATVIPYYHRFLKAFPQVRALADAAEQEVLAMWEGLGYYRRARQLHAAARKVRDEHEGAFPESFDEVIALPGIGRYTAGAILSIGRDQRLPILEANTIRLFTRLLNDARDPTQSSTQKTLWEFAEAVLPAGNAGNFNQALMELGSQLCTPREPACHRCPIQDECLAWQRGEPDSLPRHRRRVRYEEVQEAAVVVRKGERILVRQCGEGERWSGLWDFPRFPLNQPRVGESSARLPPSPTSPAPGPATVPATVRLEVAEKLIALTGIQATVGQTLTTIKHGVTRFRITLHCFEAEYQGGRRRPGHAVDWLAIKQIKNLPLSVTGRKLVEIL